MKNRGVIVPRVNNVLGDKQFSLKLYKSKWSRKILRGRKHCFSIFLENMTNNEPIIKIFLSIYLSVNQITSTHFFRILFLSSLQLFCDVSSKTLYLTVRAYLYLHSISLSPGFAKSFLKKRTFRSHKQLLTETNPWSKWTTITTKTLNQSWEISYKTGPPFRAGTFLQGISDRNQRVCNNNT